MARLQRGPGSRHDKRENSVSPIDPAAGLLALFFRFAKGLLFILLGRSDERYMKLKSRLVLWSARLGFYEAEIYREIPRLLKAGDVAVDAGANCGVYTRRFLDCVGAEGHVYAFEPNPLYLPFLESFAQKTPSVLAVMAEAVGQSPSRSFLKIPRITGGAPEPALAHLVSEKGLENLEVSVVTLDERLASLQRLDLLKIDIEGGEALAILGALSLLRKFHPVVVVESADKDALAHLLEQNGLEYAGRVKNAWRKLRYVAPRPDATYILFWKSPGELT